MGRAEFSPLYPNRPKYRLLAALFTSLFLGSALIQQPAMGNVLRSSIFAFPTIYGGQVASTETTAVALLVANQNGVWNKVCTASVWKPRLLITAAHCLTDVYDPAQLAVYQPGSSYQIGTSGPIGAGPAKVVRIFIDPRFNSRGVQVSEFDFAVMQLDTDLITPSISRLASAIELQRWAQLELTVDHVGYGLSGYDLPSSAPNSVSLPMRSVYESLQGDITFSTRQTSTQGLCPGDSGSPATGVLENEVLLFGPMVGSNAPCSSFPAFGLNGIGNTGSLASNYIQLLSSALSSTNYPEIPGSVQGLSLKLIENQSTKNRFYLNLSWQPPVISPNTVIDYEVSDINGNKICITATTNCEIANLTAGDYSYSVRPRNIQGEGASFESISISLGAPSRMARPFKINSSAVAAPELKEFANFKVLKYVFTTNSGRVVCRGRPPKTNNSLSNRIVICYAGRVLKPGKYRFQVKAITTVGSTPLSPRSKVIYIR